MVIRLCCILIGYFIGCIQTAFLVSKLFRTDLRTKGSGNLGTTNALRVLGRRAGIATFAGDILKAVAAFVLCYFLFRDYGVTAGLYGWVGVVLGHDFPFYLQLKGGKGIAATIGLIFCMATVNIWILAVSFTVGILAVAITRYISAGSLVFTASIPVMMFLTAQPAEWTLITLCMTALAFWKHRANIKRLASGTENKFYFRKSE